MRRIVWSLVAGLALAATTPIATAEAATPTVLPAAASSIVIHSAHLALGQGETVTPYDFTGINAYTLTSLWGTNWGCGWGGWTPDTLDSFFSSLAPNEIVRTWFFQQFATQITPTGSVRNWTALDQVVSEADKYHVHLVLTLGNQDGTCDDGHWKDEAWYAGGYRGIENQGFTIGGEPVDTTTTSYAQWVHDVVTRYAGNPAIAMWEPINEPQALDCSWVGSACWGAPWGTVRSCPDEATANQAMRSFFDVIGGEIHLLDPGTLVSDGSLGAGSCGEATTADFDHVIASPGIDVVGYHDYSGYGTPSNLGPMTEAAARIGKPMMVGESGVTGCSSATQRAQIYQSKMTSAFGLGVSAYLAWWYDGDDGQPTCSSPIDTDSPVWMTLQAAAHASGPTVLAAPGSTSGAPVSTPVIVPAPAAAGTPPVMSIPPVLTATPALTVPALIPVRPAPPRPIAAPSPVSPAPGGGATVTGTLVTTTPSGPAVGEGRDTVMRSRSSLTLDRERSSMLVGPAAHR